MLRFFEITKKQACQPRSIIRFKNQIMSHRLPGFGLSISWKKKLLANTKDNEITVF